MGNEVREHKQIAVVAFFCLPIAVLSLVFLWKRIVLRLLPATMIKWRPFCAHAATRRFGPNFYARHRYLPPVSSTWQRQRLSCRPALPPTRQGHGPRQRFRLAGGMGRGRRLGGDHGSSNHNDRHGQNHECSTATRRWLQKVVIGQGLCPFAAAVEKSTRIIATEAEDETSLRAAVDAELTLLASRSAEQLPTTVLVLSSPHFCADFFAYLDALELVETAVADAGLEGIVQVASFHPEYVFEDSAPDDPANFTNRSPHPCFHFLREDDVTSAVASMDDSNEIPRRNIRHFRKLGLAAVRELCQGSGVIRRQK